MDDITRPLTKYASRIRNDQRATSRYAARPLIDRWHEQRRLEKQISEVWA